MTAGAQHSIYGHRYSGGVFRTVSTTGTKSSAPALSMPTCPERLNVISAPNYKTTLCIGFISILHSMEEIAYHANFHREQ
jgi:hypothetical protein